MNHAAWFMMHLTMLHAKSVTHGSTNVSFYSDSELPKPQFSIGAEERIEAMTKKSKTFIDDSFEKEKNKARL